MRKIELKKERGITLIALVITIIILLILAGVTISALSGDNGILKNAVNASNKTNIESAREQILMEVLASYDKTGNININTLKLNLKNNLGIDTSNIGNELPFSKISLNNYEFSITRNGEVVYGNLLSTTINSNNYGDYIYYPIDLNDNGNMTDDWRIFYNDGIQVFIIAADYVKSDSEFLDLNTAEMYRVSDDPNYSDYIYAVNWYNSATSSVTFNTHIGNAYIDNNIANLFMYNKFYLSYPESDLINSKMTSSLLDTLAWKKFVYMNYADYAIGGPTLEMWVESYNSNQYDNIYYNNINFFGYYIGTNEDSTESVVNIVDLENNGYNNTLYFPYKSSANNCNGYWFASPAANGNFGIYGVAYTSRLTFRNYNDNGFGLRPVVSLKDSIVGVQENGIWSISN